MKSHELARILLSHPDLDVSTVANNHTSHRDNFVRLVSSGKQWIEIGNFCPYKYETITEKGKTK
jgi:hypothetical protein